MNLVIRSLPAHAHEIVKFLHENATEMINGADKNRSERQLKSNVFLMLKIVLFPLLISLMYVNEDQRNGLSLDGLD